MKVTATGNVVQNLTSKATAGIVALEAMAITSATGSGPSLISGNTVRNLNVAAGSTAGALYAIDLTLPQTGNVAVGVSIYSDGGGVQFALNTDTALCPEPQRIIDRFAPELDKLVWLALMLPWAA